MRVVSPHTAINVQNGMPGAVLTSTIPTIADANPDHPDRLHAVEKRDHSRQRSIDAHRCPALTPRGVPKRRPGDALLVPAISKCCHFQASSSTEYPDSDAPSPD